MNKDKNNIGGMKNLFFVIITVLLAIIASVIFVIVLWYIKKLDNKENNDNKNFEAYYKDFTDDDVLYENGELFVDSQLLLTAKEGTPKEKIIKLAKEYDGEIVGYIGISDDYQVEFSDHKTYNELNNIIEIWSENKIIESVSLHIVFQVNYDSVKYTEDPWLAVTDTKYVYDTSGSEWSEAMPSGANWWSEAIMMPTVWNQNINYATVKVGIIDSMFDTSNEDLQNKFVRTYQNPENVTALYCQSLNVEGEKPANYSHGTHVAGIIAAEAENHFGIAGVSQNAELYGFAKYGEKSHQFTSVMEDEYAIALFLNDGIKVINKSMGSDVLAASAQFDSNEGLTSETSKALETLEVVNSTMESFLSKCLKHYDFVYVLSAGNACNTNWIKNEISTEKDPYSYKDGGIGEERVEISSKYMAYADIKDINVRNHILIVGSCDLNYDKKDKIPSCSETIFSNGNPDIYAPGGTCRNYEGFLGYQAKSYGILSDIPNNCADFMIGTSMAAPMVTGVAALIWGINPDLMGIEVRDIIINSSLDNHLGINMVNAEKAVQLTCEGLDNASESEVNIPDAGIIMGYAYTEGDKEDSINLVEDTIITVYDENGIQTICEIGIEKDGTFNEFLTPGKYVIKVESDTYGGYMENIEIKERQVTYLTIEMVNEVEEHTPEDSHKATIIWEDFLISGNYSSYTKNWTETSLEYVMTDLNADTIPELLIQSSLDAPFYNTWVFVLDSNDIVLANETYGYGSFCYSPSHNAVIGSPEWKPFSGTGYSPFYRLQGTQLEYIFQVGQDEGNSYYSDSNGHKNISDDERSAYYVDVVNFEWNRILSLVPATSSSKFDLYNYFGMDIYSIINTFYDDGYDDSFKSEDGSIGFSEGGITISAGYGRSAIDFISIIGNCEYSIKGIEFGMSFADATAIAYESCSYITDDLSYYKRFIMNDGATLSFSAEDGKVTSINLFVD